MPREDGVGWRAQGSFLRSALNFHFIHQGAGDTVCTVWQFVELCASDVSFSRCMLDVCSFKCFDAMPPSQ